MLAFEIRTQEEMRLSKNSSSRGGYGISSPRKGTPIEKDKRLMAFLHKSNQKHLIMMDIEELTPPLQKNKEMGGEGMSGEQLVPY